jgi:outer membrane PBP1 activator LpoA protein
LDAHSTIKTLSQPLFTEIAMLLDRSGSMADMATEAIGGFNSFLEDHQKQPGRAILTLVLFDHEYIVAQDGCPVQEVQKLDANSYQPRGTTALLDAIFDAVREQIALFKRRFLLSELVSVRVRKSLNLIWTG